METATPYDLAWPSRATVDALSCRLVRDGRASTAGVKLRPSTLLRSWSWYFVVPSTAKFSEARESSKLTAVVQLVDDFDPQASEEPKQISKPSDRDPYEEPIGHIPLLEVVAMGGLHEPRLDFVERKTGLEPGIGSQNAHIVLLIESLGGERSIKEWYCGGNVILVKV